MSGEKRSAERARGPDDVRVAEPEQKGSRRNPTGHRPSRASIGTAAFIAIQVLGGTCALAADNSLIGADGPQRSDAARTLGKLARRWIIFDVGVSPDGRRTALLSYRGLPESDQVEFALAVVANEGVALPVNVARYAMPASAAMTKDLQPAPRPTVAAFRWSPNGRSLAYLSPGDRGVDLRTWDALTSRSRTILARRQQIELLDGGVVGALGFVTRETTKLRAGAPIDRALRVKDGFRFDDPFTYPNDGAPLREEAWTFDWGHRTSRAAANAKIVSANVEPSDLKKVSLSSEHPFGRVTLVSRDHKSPDEKAVVREIYSVSNAQSSDAARLERGFEFVRPGTNIAPVPITSAAEDQCRMVPVGWTSNSVRFIFLEQCEATSSVLSVSQIGAVRTLFKAPALFDIRGSRPAAEIDPAGRFVVLTRSSTFSADDLICVDLQNGEVRTLARPNGSGAIANPVKTVVMRPSDDVFKARLYLPPRRVSGKTPLVVSLYYSNPGLETSTGDELPILPLVESGIAVLTFDAQSMISGFRVGDPRWEVARVERPRRAIEQLIADAAAQYGIDPVRVGIGGLSYGAEIAMYVYWKSGKFRAVSAAGGSLAPSWVMLGGLGYATRLAQRGLTDPANGLEPVWKEVSAALNGRADLPPLLWQTPSSERLDSVESWDRLHKAGAQLEWWDYPDETHELWSPADRWSVQQRNLDWFRFWLQDDEDTDPLKGDQYTRWRTMRDLWGRARTHAASEHHQPDQREPLALRPRNGDPDPKPENLGVDARLGVDSPSSLVPASVGRTSRWGPS